MPIYLYTYIDGDGPAILACFPSHCYPPLSYIVLSVFLLAFGSCLDYGSESYSLCLPTLSPPLSSPFFFFRIYITMEGKHELTSREISYHNNCYATSKPNDGEL